MTDQSAELRERAKTTCPNWVRHDSLTGDCGYCHWAVEFASQEAKRAREEERERCIHATCSWCVLQGPPERDDRGNLFHPQPGEADDVACAARFIIHSAEREAIARSRGASEPAEPVCENGIDCPGPSAHVPRCSWCGMAGVQHVDPCEPRVPGPDGCLPVLFTHRSVCAGGRAFDAGVLND